LRRKGVASGGISLTLDPFQLPRNRNFTRSGDDGTIRNLDNLIPFEYELGRRHA